MISSSTGLFLFFQHSFIREATDPKPILDLLAEYKAEIVEEEIVDLADEKEVSTVPNFHSPSQSVSVSCFSPSIDRLYRLRVVRTVPTYVHVYLSSNLSVLKPPIETEADSSPAHGKRELRRDCRATDRLLASVTQVRSVGRSVCRMQTNILRIFHSFQPYIGGDRRLQYVLRLPATELLYLVDNVLRIYLHIHPFLCFSSEDGHSIGLFLRTAS